MDKISVYRTNNDEAVSLLANKVNELVEWANDIDIQINQLGIVDDDIITRIELLENATKTD